ncbi:MAG: DUF1552 domain-containing protein [Myxococcales bacterium]|nr:DUF1552 domain-containing protein [Myxococcales bacterium]
MPLIRSSKTKLKFSRRAFLAQTGVGAAFVPMLLDERARAQGGRIQRLITIAWPNGVAQPEFYAGNTDPTSRPILAPLAPVKAKVSLIAGLDVQVMMDDRRQWDGHFSYPSLFTGTYRNVGGSTGQSATATGPSLDHVVANSFAKTVNLPEPLMTIVAAGGESTSYRGNDQRNAGESDPKRLFTKLFGDGKASPSQPDAFDLTRARRSRVLDVVNEDLKAFKNRLGAEDKLQIDAHLDSVSTLKKQLEAQAAQPVCETPSLGNPGDYPARVKAFMDLIAMALRCDVTRTVSFTFGANTGSDPTTMPYAGVSGDVHNIAHEGPGGYAKKVKIDTWYVSQIAHLALALEAVKEGSGSLLDNSVIVAASDMCEGSMHDISQGIPVVLIGTAGGKLKGGQVLKVGSWAGKTGTYWKSGATRVPHNHLLTTIGNALGVATDGFGDARYKGRLSGLEA